MDPRKPGPGKRVLPPGADQSPLRRRRTAAPQDPRVVQASQSLGNMSLASTSYGQPLSQSRRPPPGTTFENFPNTQPPMPGYGHTQISRLSRLDDAETTKLWNAVASGLNFQNIKKYIFSARRDLTAQMLEDHAERIGARWAESEDLALRRSGIKENSSHKELVRIREEKLKDICPTRSVDDIRVRYAYLMAKDREDNFRNPLAGGHVPYGHQNQFTHNAQSHITAPPIASPWPAKHYGAPRPMHEAFRGPQGQNGNICGPSDGSRIGSPICSDHRWQSFLVDNWEELAGPSTGSQNSLHARSQALDARQSTPPAPPGQTQSRSRGHIGRRGGPAGAVDLPKRSYRTLSKEDQDNIRVIAAGGVSLREISEFEYRDINPLTLASAMHRSGWRVWSEPQSDQLLDLHRELGNNWAAISSRLAGVWRSPRELEARVEYLKENPDAGEPRVKVAAQRRPRHKYTDQEDMYIRRRLAQGHGVAHFAAEFPHAKPSDLRRHASLIGAEWRDPDDSRLDEMVPRYGKDVDWDTIGREYTPPRPGEIVEMRWRHL